MLKVNVSPLFRSHSLFVPRITEVLAQEITSTDALLEVFSLFGTGRALMPARASDVWVGFNSKGALSSVDHLHFQVGMVRELLQPGKSSLFIQELSAKAQGSE